MTTFLTDTFTDSDGTALVDHTSDSGHGWIAVAIGSPYTSTGLYVYDNRLKRTTTAGYIYGGAYANLTAPSADYTVEAAFYVEPSIYGGEASIHGRRLGATQTCYIFRYNNAFGQWRLYKGVAGSYTLLGSSNASLTNGQTYTVKLEMIGTSIRCLVDGVELFAVTDSSVTAAGTVLIEEFGASTVGETRWTSITAYTGVDLPITRVMHHRRQQG